MINETYAKTEEEMLSTLSVLNKHLDKVRTGRVNLSLFESIQVECYDKSINLNQIASIVIISNNSVKITPWDMSNINNINKAIMNSNLGVNPSVIDNTIKINFPPMNEERRIELIKFIKKTGENIKINIRNIRRDKNNIIKKLLKNKEITKDEEKSMQEKIQNITNKFISEVNKCLKNKEIELMKI
jgi:ribosome recycling factor